ncbi:hypothetical protein GCM10012284_07030 [Mangrovihabitans endophyticus]|uniref:Uncharacterized protein n=1 Tax=Mangrovihabitans endophyticus TaxID=1751298 RepID=A0A8J3BW64_9ACTN|nr:hypothetical protein GCM10012284_07030 [Mangrovihabitans endophyticus]
MSGGPDVWEVITALNAIREESPQASQTALLGELGDVTGLSAAQVSAALRYYAAYPGEVEERIALNEEVAEREEQLWAAQQKLLQKPMT